MGLLSKLLNPKSAIVNPGGALLKKVGINAPDPGGDLLQGLAKQVNPSAGTQGGGSTAAVGSAADSSGTYGDPSDSSYGSFTKPFDAEEFYKYEDPGYWFRLQQGQQALQNSAAAGSGALSGAALKDLLGYNQDMASTEYGNAFNRYQTQQGNIFSRLFQIAGLGQNAAAGVGATGAGLAGQAGQAITNAGTATGSGIVGGANAITNGATNAWLWNQMNQQKPMMASGTGGV